MATLAPRLKSGDVGWLVMFVGIVVFEFTADDLLSDATERYCRNYPWFARAIIGAVAAHLAGVMPPQIDILSAQNVLHKKIFARIPFARPARACHRNQIKQGTAS